MLYNPGSSWCLLHPQLLFVPPLYTETSQSILAHTVQVNVSSTCGLDHGILSGFDFSSHFLCLQTNLFLDFKDRMEEKEPSSRPTPLPLLGNILQISRGGMVTSLMKLSEKYGDVYTVYMGSRPVVVVTGYKTVKEILMDRGDDFLARGEMPMFDVYYKNYGVALTSNMDRWRELRRFSLTTLRDFGMGKSSIEDRIVEEALCLVAELKKTKDSILNPRQYLNQATCNIIFSIMFGNRCEYETEELNTIVSCMNEAIRIVSSAWGQIFEMFPSIMRILPGPHRKMFWCMEKLLQFVNSRIKMNGETLDPHNPRDYIDSFLIKIEKEKNNPNTKYTIKNLSFSTLQIFFAGADTISTTLTYSLLILMKHSDVLAKVHEEIDRVIGQNQHPKLQDRKKMPYTDAVMHEIQRYADLFPMGLPRKTPYDVQFRGYTIPKDTNVFPMLTSVLRDPSCFLYPDEFNPKNFLEENGDLKKNNGFMPLSAGKRICLGEALVRMELFLLLVTILQNFDLKSLVPLEDLDLAPEVSGLGNIPKPYKLSFITRSFPNLTGVTGLVAIFGGPCLGRSTEDQHRWTGILLSTGTQGALGEDEVLQTQDEAETMVITGVSHGQKQPSRVVSCPSCPGLVKIVQDKMDKTALDTFGEEREDELLSNQHFHFTNFIMDATFLLALSVPLLIFFLGLKSYRKRGNLPPGPTPLPLLGNILHIKSGEIVKSLMVLSEKYGDVYTIYLGSRPVVIVTGYKTVKEILVNRGDEFLARGDLPMFDLYYKNYGVALTNNMERWREMRRFSINTMRGFGMGKKTTEERTLEELGHLVAELKKMEGTTLNPHDLFSKANCHTLFTIIFGDRQENEDEDINNMLSYIHETFSIVCSVWGQVFEMFPNIMRYLPGGHQRMFRSFEKLLKLTEKRIEMNQKMLDQNNPTSYVDAFLIKMEKEKSNQNTEYHMMNLLCCTLQIFFSGVETTSTTMTYSILLLMKFPDVLAKVQEEIDRVIGQNRSPQVKDRNEMPYTDAVIHEIQRFSDLLPMGVPRKVTQDVEFRGYNIPKDTNVFPMLGSVLKDPTCFPQPEEFNPNNFLDENGEFKKNDAFMPLSAGKRNCLGEALVRMQLFLFLVTIVQNFSLKSPVPPEELDIKPNVSGLGNLPKPYKLAFIPR
ncbi:uncharacterized protein O3C94_015729 [Discoglossus pictus]